MHTDSKVIEKRISLDVNLVLNVQCIVLFATGFYTFYVKIVYRIGPRRLSRDALFYIEYKDKIIYL